jgi:hypothetical protein
MPWPGKPSPKLSDMALEPKPANQTRSDYPYRPHVDKRTANLKAWIEDAIKG